jgi:ParB-like chromosome segregation protein Spo0J
VGSYQIFDRLTDEEFAALKADIALRGVLVPIEYDDEGNVLDGHHRLLACRELGIENFPAAVRHFPDDEARRMHIISLNLRRRHMTAEQRRVWITEALKLAPQLSNRQHARALAVDAKTVAAVRVAAQEAGEIPHVPDLQGSDGKMYPATSADHLNPRRPADPTATDRQRHHRLLARVKPKQPAAGWVDPLNLGAQTLRELDQHLARCHHDDEAIREAMEHVRQLAWGSREVSA